MQQQQQQQQQGEAKCIHLVFATENDTVQTAVKIEADEL